MAMSESIEHHLLTKLQSDDETVRMLATQELWQIWFKQKGLYGLGILSLSQTQIERGELAAAERTLTDLILAEPDFAEAWNRRAVLYYMQEQYDLAIADCHATVKLNPHHFGAWHGLGLSQMALANYPEAIAAFHQALSIQPYALVNQRLILECSLKLNP
ncbi:MAG: tetratricopeptide repeat protein [Pseudanabaenaceae cyanobacterium bins.68]|nr:tetratricopeptide repeat protein [Pseudanabaenaceae cyanobacterium bins.68]